MDTGIVVIMTTYNRPDALRESLCALMPQAKDMGARVVVVDDGTPGGCVELVAEHGVDQYIWQQDEGYRLATARNVGAIAVEGWSGFIINTVICFLDGDLTLDRGWLCNMVSAARSNKFGCPSIAISNINGSNLLSPKLLKTRPWLAFTGGCCAMEWLTWKGVGEYDERFNGNWGCEDTEWAFRATKWGCKLQVAGGANVTHRPHAPQQDHLKGQERNWHQFASKYSNTDLGPRPMPVRTDHDSVL